MQYRLLTLANDASGNYKPISLTNPHDSYWQQLEALKSAFERDWTEAGQAGRPPGLYGLSKLDHNNMVWNRDEVSILNLVRQSIDSCTRTHAARSRKQAENRRTELRKRLQEFKDEETDEEETDEEGVEEEEAEGEEIDRNGEPNIVVTGEGGSGEDDVVMEEGGVAEVDEEDEMEEG